MDSIDTSRDGSEHGSGKTRRRVVKKIVKKKKGEIISESIIHQTSNIQIEESPTKKLKTIRKERRIEKPQDLTFEQDGFEVVTPKNIDQPVCIDGEVSDWDSP